MTDPAASRRDERLALARVLVELGELAEAEVVVADLLDAQPDDLEALSLLAKVKHMAGQLSQAVACWAQLHARSPMNETALMHLGALLHLAQDPERGAGEFLALGQLQLMKRPAAHLELEEAFRLLLARRPDEARARCDRLAVLHRRSDPALFKLATLAGAWIAELAGDPEAAVAALEGLGEERGFETDTDRVMMLVRLYERIGSRDKLEAAVHIYRYLEDRFSHVGVLARLGPLHRSLGNVALAEEYERRHTAAFRRSMHRASRSDAVRAAALCYLPLDRLRTIPRQRDEQVAAETPRERAIERALAGEHAAARELLAAGDEVLDRKYLADLAALDGDEEEAERLYLAALALDRGDPRVVGRLLERYDGSRSPAIAAALRDPEVAGEAAEALRAAILRTPGRPALWRQLGLLLGLREDSEASARAALERAAVLERAAREQAHPVGRVLAAGVYHFVGKRKGLIHEVWASREVALPGRGGTLPPDRVLGNVAPELRQAIQNTFLSVREYARTVFPHLTGDLFDYTYTYKITKDDEASYGASAGLPTAMAFLSVFLQRPVPQDVALTGVVVSDSHHVLVLRPVGDTDRKVKAAYHRNLRAIVVPAGNAAELEASPIVPAAVRAELVRYAADLDQAVRLVFGDEVFLHTMATRLRTVPPASRP